MLGVSLLFSSFFENKIDSVLRKDYGDFDTAIKQDSVFHMINVGNGDCLAVELPDGKKMLIDCGEDIKSTKYEQNALSYLTNVVFDGETNSEKRIFDYFILTHPHEDHDKMAKLVFDNFNIKTVYRPAVFYNENNDSTSQEELERAKQAGFVANDVSSWEDVTTVETVSTTHYKTFVDCVKNEGSTVYYTYQGLTNFAIKGENYELKTYWPLELKLGKDLNEYSPIMILNCNGKNICLTGDSVLKSEKYVAENYALPKVDLLKVGHHGSAGASDETFLNEIKPTYAFISCSSDNSYGHPNQKALSRIQKSGVLSSNILTTKDSGNLVFAITEDSTILVSASDGVVYVKIKWWYVCGVLLVVSAVIIFLTPSNAKKVLKSKEFQKIVKK